MIHKVDNNSNCVPAVQDMVASQFAIMFTPIYKAAQAQQQINEMLTNHAQLDRAIVDDTLVR